MARKTGVYVCKGCGIGEAIDTQKLVDLARASNPGGPVRTSPAFCLEDAQLIRGDIEQDGVDSAVIAACSLRVNTDVFRFKPAFVERVNLREQVTWSHPAGHEETQSLAEDNLRMGLVRAQKATPPTPYTEANERTVLVVGGGAAGISAAISAARSGFGVVLVEKEAELGGYAARLYKQFPTRPPYQALEAPEIADQLRALRSLPGVTIMTGAEVREVSGQPGRFSAKVESGAGSTDIVVGAIVLATGWRPAGSQAYERYGLGKLANVVTSADLEAMAAKGAITRPSDRRPARRVAFLLCDGREDEAHLAYGGNVPSLVALKQAAYVRATSPDAVAYIFYEDMQTPGQHEYFYKSVQRDPGVLLSRGQVNTVSEDRDRNIVLDLGDTLIGGDIQLAVDLLVLATDMVPSTLDAEGALGLTYLQGKNVPTTKFGYADSHFICFPYETRRTGIYSAGAVRQPMDLSAAARDGRAAALKALQSIEKSSAGQAVHPRVGDLTYPGFFMQKCTSCGRCTQECPFGALELNEKKNPVLNTNRCRRCGICMGACPVQIISFTDYSVDMLSSMIKAVEIPEGDEDKPRILAFACENDAYPALDMAGIQRLQYPASVRVIPVRCLGSVNSILIADAVSRGFDGVALLGCKPGEDYQCHFIRGSELLQTRMGNVQETLERLALEPERVKVMELAISECDKIPAMLEEFVNVIKTVGPNPMKGF
ncbi:MAG TPA: hydrogenase iron-sulfur subunit [Methylomirabilota bacterium]|jgi:quinone-modifying oxidoreductase subunit QmoB|nr:hydrogenase iron-sulfur subunit [Methylomirabilota bacterium]